MAELASQRRLMRTSALGLAVPNSMQLLADEVIE
jgi:hypothetical protein